MNEKNFQQCITKYFRKTVIDSERLSIDVKSLLKAVKPPSFHYIKHSQPFSIPISYWQNGFFPLELTQKIFYALKAAPNENCVTILVVPRLDLHHKKDTYQIGKQSPIMTPLVAEVILNREGKLSPSSLPPCVPREFLAPNDGDQIPFAETENLDQFYTRYPFNVTDWEELKDYCLNILTSLQPDKDHDTLYSHPIHEDYEPHPSYGLVHLETPITSGMHIINVYDCILKGQEPSALYQKLINLNENKKSDYQDLTYNKQCTNHHLGQMNDRFPLAAKQRNALHHLQKLNENEMLAVNGPPGTGKTTLISSIVADLWVKAALEGFSSEPPLIVTTSSNNKAVTNVLDNFSNCEDQSLDTTLQGRWLPGIDSYGLYACAESIQTNGIPYFYVKRKGDGSMNRVESNDYIKEAKPYFIEKFNQWSTKKKASTIKEAAELIHASLVEHQEAHALILTLFETYQNCKTAIKKEWSRTESLNEGLHFLQQEISLLGKLLQKLKDEKNTFLKLCRKRSLVSQLFSFIPTIKSRFEIENELFCSERGMNFKSYKYRTIKNYFSTTSSKLSLESKIAQKKLQRLMQLNDILTMHQENFEAALEKAPIEINESEEELTLPKLIEKLDQTTRFRLFKLASHYWEARWLIEMEHHQRDKMGSVTHLLKRYRRWAKLMPCMVVTLNTLPFFFTARTNDAGVWKNEIGKDSIDLLIVDEAGQALPHIAAASFALAKKALLVGDIYQIAPVSTLSEGVDKANLQTCELLTTSDSYHDVWLKSYLTGAVGNLMKVAHRHQQQIQFEDLEPGLYLTEHRRCYDSIIHFCNHLAYKNRLEPLRGEPSKNGFWPTMGFINHKSHSETHCASRVNHQEIQLILKWLKKHQKILSEQFQSIAIITPFALQARYFRSQLNKLTLPSIQAGTVHTFQGAESDLVIFSSVYGSNDKGKTKFYDIKAEILNVAVSRAKNAFIAFGDEEIFSDSFSGNPSSILMKYLTACATFPSYFYQIFELQRLITHHFVNNNGHCVR